MLSLIRQILAGENPRKRHAVKDPYSARPESSRDPGGSRRWPRHTFDTRPSVHFGADVVRLVDLSLSGAQIMARGLVHVGECRDLIFDDGGNSVHVPAVVLH